MTDTGRPARVSICARALILLLTGLCQTLQGQQRDSVLFPVQNLRVAIHVFQDDAGLRNFRADSKEQNDFLLRLVDWANNRLANLDTLKPAVSSPFVSDSRVRIRLDTIYYHQDSRAWDCSSEIDSPYMRERYVDGDSLLNYRQRYQTLPVFIGANNPVTGGHSSSIGDRGYIAVRGYYESFLRLNLPGALDECGRNLIHELGHCLGLVHNFTGGSEGDQCDNCDDNGCPQQGTSNNIMDYWPSYGYALSKCQFDLIHFYLNGGLGNISEIVINDSCYSVSGEGYQVPEGDTLVIRDTVYAHRDWVINSGAVLKISGYLSMPGETKITVGAGGDLRIDGGTIGNLCGDLWEGIRIDDGPDGSPAKIAITHGGIVEHARTGLLAAGRVETELDSCQFRNCHESMAFLKGSVDSIRVKNSTFQITDKLNHYEEGITPGIFLLADSIPGVIVTGCRFINEPGTLIFDADWMGTGISAISHFIHIDHSDFINLTNGLNLNAQNAGSKLEVIDNQFTKNRYGIRTQFAGVQWIANNRLILQRFNSGSTIGMLLRNADRFGVSGNHLESGYGGGRMAGIVLDKPTSESSPVFWNTFLNLPVGVFMEGIPGIDSVLFHWAENSNAEESLKLGPQFRFNQFDTVGMPLAVLIDSAYGSAIGAPDDVSKEYSIPATGWTPGGFAWYNDQVQMLAFRGCTLLPDLKPDHGLYWFMNYLGITASLNTASIGQRYGNLKDYLLKMKAIEESGDQLFTHGIFDALNRMSEVPATARSAKIAAYWVRYQAEEQIWLWESLASIAGRFVQADSLLTGLGTELALKNKDQWESFRPGGILSVSVPVKTSDEPSYDLPDLSMFRFFRQGQEKSPLPAFWVYPNPAEDDILIQPRSGFSFEQAWHGNLISETGRLVKKIRIESWETQKVKVTGLPSGVYIIELYSGIQYLGAVKFLKSTLR